MESKDQKSSVNCAEKMQDISVQKGATSVIKKSTTEITLNIVHCMDCLDVMKEIPDNYFDLVLTDPPYGINIMNSGGHPKKHGFRDWGKKDWDDDIPTKKYFNEIIRISKNQIIWGGNYFTEYLFPSSCWIFWFKQHGMTFADGELAWTSYKQATRQFDKCGMGGQKEHPTQKPVELMVWCLENYLMKKWDKDRKPRVFDGFAGSGTTGVACKKSGCDYVLVEKEKDYIDVIEKRLKQETLF